MTFIAIDFSFRTISKIPGLSTKKTKNWFYKNWRIIKNVIFQFQPHLFAIFYLVLCLQFWYEFCSNPFHTQFISQNQTNKIINMLTLLSTSLTIYCQSFSIFFRTGVKVLFVFNIKGHPEWQSFSMEIQPPLKCFNRHIHILAYRGIETISVAPSPPVWSFVLKLHWGPC